MFKTLLYFLENMIDGRVVLDESRPLPSMVMIPVVEERFSFGLGLAVLRSGAAANSLKNNPERSDRGLPNSGGGMVSLERCGVMTSVSEPVWEWLKSRL